VTQTAEWISAPEVCDTDVYRYNDIVSETRKYRKKTELVKHES